MEWRHENQLSKQPATCTDTEELPQKLLNKLNINGITIVGPFPAPLYQGDNELRAKPVYQLTYQGKTYLLPKSLILKIAKSL